jgi:HK97 family phage portal protein
MTQLRSRQLRTAAQRSLPQPDSGDARSQPPNDTPPGVNPPPTTSNPPGDYNPVSVGPNASEGFGNTNVATIPQNAPVPVSAWSGWPNNWQTPLWNSNSDNGSPLSQWSRLADIVFACLDLNCSILSSMPPYLVNNGNRQGGRTWLTNPEPMAYASWAEAAKEFFWSYIAAGECIIYCTARYADGYPQRFMMLNPALVNVERANGRVEYSVARVPVPSEDILHIKYASWPGDLRGHGPLEVAGARLLTIAALQKYATNLATTGGLPPAIIKYPRRASRAQMQQMQFDWIEARASLMGVPAVLADGAELDVLNPQLQDAALADLSKFSEARIATLLSVPPFLVGLSGEGASTYINATNVFDFHWRAGLRPKAEAFAQALAGWLLPRGWTVELDKDDYIKPGMFERAQSYSMLISAGVLTPQQVAIMERFDTAPGDNDPNIATQDEPAEAFGAPGRPTETNTGAGVQEATTL